jgi:hypothetical protein
MLKLDGGSAGVSSNAAVPALGPGRWPMRLARSATFALVGIVLAVGAHRLGGGAVPAMAVLVPATTAILAFAVLASGRQRSGRYLAAAMIGLQAALHVGFTLAAARTGPSQTTLWGAVLFCHPSSSAPTRAQIETARAILGVSNRNAPVSAVQLAAATAHAGAGMDWTMAALMLLGHLIAAGMTAWWLRRGERSLWAVSRRAVARLNPTLRTHLPVLPGSIIVPVPNRVQRPRTLWWAATRSERGPPPRREFEFIAA